MYCVAHMLHRGNRIMRYRHLFMCGINKTRALILLVLVFCQRLKFIINSAFLNIKDADFTSLHTFERNLQMGFYVNLSLAHLILDKLT